LVPEQERIQNFQTELDPDSKNQSPHTSNLY